MPSCPPRWRPTLMMGPSASCASSVSLAGSLVYCSMYRRMVAPEEPVPDRRKMMREPSARGRGPGEEGHGRGRAQAVGRG